MNNNLLSFCIPTWNRSLLVEEALIDLIPKIKHYGFKIIISDNASTDNTKEIVEKYQKQYDKIIYHCNDENCGPDQNFEKVLKIATQHSEYAWLLGDAYRLIPETLDEIIPILEQKKHATVFVNCHNRIKKIPSKQYDSIVSVIEEIGWHITLIGSLIYSRKVASSDYYSLYYNTNFLQDGILYEYGIQHPEEHYYWCEKNGVYASELPRMHNHWTKETFNVFAKNWTNFVLSLNSNIPTDVKLKCIKDHSINTRIFTVRKLYKLRKKGYLDYQRDVLPYKIYVPVAMVTSWRTIMFISRAPYIIAIILKFPIYLYEKLKLKSWL